MAAAACTGPGGDGISAGEIIEILGQDQGTRPSMPRAIWNGKVVAEAAHCEIVEGNYYFPADSLRMEYFRPSETTTQCHWKGTANYYSLLVDGKENRDAAWVYRDPAPAAANIKGRVAFWRGVTVEP
jgi:uncharacterized protein (DUF427 family)